MTLSDVLAKLITTPATPAEVRVAGHLVRRMLDCETGEQIVRVPTRSQVSLIFCIHFNAQFIDNKYSLVPDAVSLVLKL